MFGGAMVIVLGAIAGLVLILVAALASWPVWVRGVAVTVGVVLAAAPVLLVAVFLTGQPKPLEPDDTLAIGVRVDDGAAQVWLGPDCTDVTELRVVLKWHDSPNNDILELRSDEPTEVVESFGLTDETLPVGLQSVEPLDDEQLDLSRHYSLTVVEERSASVLLEPVVSASGTHPGEFWFGDVHGWLRPADAAGPVADGELSTVCAVAPEGTYGG